MSIQATAEMGKTMPSARKAAIPQNFVAETAPVSDKTNTMDRTGPSRKVERGNAEVHIPSGASLSTKVAEPSLPTIAAGTVLPQLPGGSFSMPVAVPYGSTIEAAGPCCNPGCRRSGYYLCSQCETAKYCSAECQLQDWPAHKAKCRVLASSNGIRTDPAAMPAKGYCASADVGYWGTSTKESMPQVNAAVL